MRNNGHLVKTINCHHFLLILRRFLQQICPVHLGCLFESHQVQHRRSHIPQRPFARGALLIGRRIGLELVRSGGAREGY